MKEFVNERTIVSALQKGLITLKEARVMLACYTNINNIRLPRQERRRTRRKYTS
jgi:hypothetical protein